MHGSTTTVHQPWTFTQTGASPTVTGSSRLRVRSCSCRGASSARQLDRERGSHGGKIVTRITPLPADKPRPNHSRSHPKPSKPDDSAQCENTDHRQPATTAACHPHHWPAGQPRKQHHRSGVRACVRACSVLGAYTLRSRPRPPASPLRFSGLDGCYDGAFQRRRSACSKGGAVGRWEDRRTHSHHSACQT